MSWDKFTSLEKKATRNGFGDGLFDAAKRLDSIGEMELMSTTV